MKKALMIVSVLFMAVISTACINNIAIQELNNKAAEYMQKGDYDAAISRLQASLDLDSSMYETYYNLGVAAIKAKKYDIAIDALQKGIKINAGYPNFYYSLGLAQFSLADEYLGLDDENEEVVESNENTTKETKVISDSDKEKALKLKQLSILTLQKYINMQPNAEDKDSVNEMIEAAQKFIDQDKPEANNTDTTKETAQ